MYKRDCLTRLRWVIFGMYIWIGLDPLGVALLHFLGMSERGVSNIAHMRDNVKIINNF